MNLYETTDGIKYMVKSVPENELLRFIGVRKASIVQVLTKQPFGGPIVVKLKNRNIAIDKMLAEKMEMECI